MALLVLLPLLPGADCIRFTPSDPFLEAFLSFDEASDPPYLLFINEYRGVLDGDGVLTLSLDDPTVALFENGRADQNWAFEINEDEGARFDVFCQTSDQTTLRLRGRYRGMDSAGGDEEVVQTDEPVDETAPFELTADPLPIDCTWLGGDDDDSTPPGDDDDTGDDDDDDTGDDDDATDPLRILGDVLLGDEVALLGDVQAPDDTPAQHSDGVQTDQSGPDPQTFSGFVARQSFAMPKFDKDKDPLEDQLAPFGLAFASSSSGAAIPPGATHLLVSQAHAPIPQSDPVNTYQYGFVFDADGVAANNYQAPPQYPADFFDGTDRWYAVDFTPAGGWSLEVTDASDGQFSSIPSDARVAVIGNTLALIVPASEFPVPAPAFRLTAFRHTGDYGIGSGDWDADIEPPVDDGLHITWD